MGTTRPEIATTDVQRSSNEDHVRCQFLSLANRAERCLPKQRLDETNLPIPYSSSLLSLCSTSADSFSTTATPRSIFSPVALPEVFVDACPYGIGFSLDDRWLAWIFTQDHPDIPRGRTGSIKSSWAELIAVELGVSVLLVAGYTNMRIRLRSDHKGVVKALKKGHWEKKQYLHDILQRILSDCQGGGLVLEPAYIWTRKNPADKPSRGKYPPHISMFECRPPVPQHLGHLVSVSPVPNEQPNSSFVLGEPPFQKVPMQHSGGVGSSSVDSLLSMQSQHRTSSVASKAESASSSRMAGKRRAKNVDSTIAPRGDMKSSFESLESVGRQQPSPSIASKAGRRPWKRRAKNASSDSNLQGHMPESPSGSVDSFSSVENQQKPSPIGFKPDKVPLSWKLWKRRARNVGSDSNNMQGHMPESPPKLVDSFRSVESHANTRPVSSLQEPKESPTTLVQADQHSSGATSAREGDSHFRRRLRKGRKSSVASLRQIEE